MTEKKPETRPSNGLNLQREINKKLFSETHKTAPSRNDRDPITQAGIHDRESELPSDTKPRGPARGEYSEKGQGSFRFEPPSNVYVSPVGLNKRAECAPVNRNPITQDHPSLAPPNPTRDREKYSKVRDSTFFNSSSETVLPKTRSNQYYDKMQSNIFEKQSPPEPARPQLKQVQTKSSEISSMLSYNDGTRPEAIANKPTANRIQNEALVQKKQLNDYAKVYNARRNQSAITFI
ncbi:hypothetical protein SteCoe_34823 [Stentor coeruleus]|uniref:Uncharacterized protein n=1 Tax=Stentor coeruleus TaxID=5963 RepID=A0A1R2ATP4_9CILI|nr:hypothetical protein SteCoe_34823 [Stentor coeruleus]